MGSSGPDGRRLYDRWSRRPGLLRLLYMVVFLGRNRHLRRRSIAALELEGGDRVLELGCGTGNALARLRTSVGPTGEVVGVDYSAGMTERAADRIGSAGWQNVHVARADAAQPPVTSGRFDAVYLAMSLSAMPDVEAVLAAAADCLKEGGRLVVLDARPFQHWPWRLLNPLVVPLAKRLTNWFPSVDIPAALRRRFTSFSITEWQGGSVYVAVARSDAAEAGSD
ncbi:MAG: class I SAM-dependent methyltransferase [Halobacteriales archaeon]